MKLFYRYLQVSGLFVLIILMCIWSKFYDSKRSVVAAFDTASVNNNNIQTTNLDENHNLNKLDEINNIQCFQLPLKSNQLNDLSVQIQFHTIKAGFKSYADQVPKTDTIIYCNEFTHDRENCQAVARNKEALEEGFFVPGGWDWRAYYRYYPEIIVWSKGHVDEFTALKHYNEVGKFEQRVARKLNLVLRYSTCGNIAEQHYSHISSITLAALLGAKLVVPPLFRKEKIAPNQNSTWTKFSQNELLDTDYLVRFWGQKGLTLDINEREIQIPDLDHPESCFQYDWYDGFMEKQYIYINDLYRTAQPVLDVLYRIKKDALFYDQGARARHAFACLNGFVVELPCTLFSLESQTVYPLFGQVANTLKFNQRIIDLADQVLEKLGGNFNAVHVDLSLNLDQIIEEYLKQIMFLMQQQNFNTKLTLYIACGKNQFQNSQVVKDIIKHISEDQLAGQISNQEHYFVNSVYNGLYPDVSDAVDLLVMLKSTYFVGVRQSTFSFYVSELRKLQSEYGQELQYTELMDLPELGNTEIIQKGGVLS